MLRRRVPEVRNAVRYRLHARQRRASGSKGPENQIEHAVSRLLYGDRLLLGRIKPQRITNQPRHDQSQHRENEQIGRHSEHHRRFSHASQVPPGQQRDNDEGDQSLVSQQGREGRSHRRGPRAGAYGHRQNIADDQRRAGRQPRDLPEILMRHDIGPATLRIGVDRLAIAEDQYQQQTDNRRHHGQKIPE